MRDEKVKIPIGKAEKISGILNLPGPFSGETGIILAHGAANDMNHPMLAFLAEGLSEAGYPTLRFNFLYRQKGRDALDSQDMLYEIMIPMLFFSGTRDQLCDLELLQGVLSRLGRTAELQVIEGADHSFSVPKSYASQPESVYERILSRITEWLNKEKASA